MPEKERNARYYTQSRKHTAHQEHGLQPLHHGGEKPVLSNWGLHPLSVELGIAVLPDAVSDENVSAWLKASLETFGFELIDDKKSQTVSR